MAARINPPAQPFPTPAPLQKERHPLAADASEIKSHPSCGVGEVNGEMKNDTGRWGLVPALPHLPCPL
jgi:hypothetical protein